MSLADLIGKHIKVKKHAPAHAGRRGTIKEIFDITDPPRVFVEEEITKVKFIIGYRFCEPDHNYGQRAAIIASAQEQESLLLNTGVTGDRRVMQPPLAKQLEALRKARDEQLAALDAE